MIRLAVESWIWYAFAMFVTVCRLVSRTLLFGSPLRLKVDDFIMLFAICTYTTLVVCMNVVADKSSNLIPPGVDVSKFTKADIDERVEGSKLVLVVEQMQCITIWTLKATLLIMYYRVTFQLPQNLYVKLLAVYVGVGFVVMEILYFAVWCRPFHDYWAVPTPNRQCDAATDHLITNAVFNLSSDIVMLAIGSSMAAKSKLPWKRRIIVHAIFALGIFVIVAAVLNKYYSFTQPYGSLWTFWYIRECSTAMIVANLPYTWTLIRRVFNVGSFDGQSDTGIKYHSSRSARGRRRVTAPPVTRGEPVSDKQSSASDSRNDSSMDHTRNDMSSPVQRERVEAIKPAARKTWRERGVYGKGDAELLESDDELDMDLEAQEARRHFSDAINNTLSDGAHDEITLHDVGSLSSSPSALLAQSHQAASSARHVRHKSDQSVGRRSPDIRRTASRSGAPEYWGRPPSVRSRGDSRPTSPRPHRYSGMSLPSVKDST